MQKSNLRIADLDFDVAPGGCVEAVIHLPAVFVVVVVVVAAIPSDAQ